MHGNSLSLELENQNRHIEQLAQQTERQWGRIANIVHSTLDDNLGQNGYMCKPPTCNFDSVVMRVVSSQQTDQSRLILTVRLAITRLHTEGPDFEFSISRGPSIAFGPLHSPPPTSYSELSDQFRRLIELHLRKPVAGALPAKSQPGILAPQQAKIRRVVKRVAELLRQS